jgi:hypothetical protein
LQTTGRPAADIRAEDPDFTFLEDTRWLVTVAGANGTTGVYSLTVTQE